MLQSPAGLGAQPPPWQQPAQQLQQPQQMWSSSQQTPAQVQTQPQLPSSYSVAAGQDPQDRSILPPEAQQHLAAMRGPYGMQTAPQQQQQPQQYASYGVASSGAFSMPCMQPAGSPPQQQQQQQLQAPPAYQQQFQPQQQYQAPPQQQQQQLPAALPASYPQQATTPGSFLQSGLLPQQQQSNVVYSVDPFSLLQVLCSSYLPMHVQAGNLYQVFDETGRRRIKATIMLHGLLGPDNNPRALPCTATGDSVQDAQAAAAACALSCLFLTCGLPLSEGLMQLYFERYGQQWQPDAAAVQEGLRLPMPVAPPLTNTQTPKPMISQLAVKAKVSQKYEGPVPGSGMFGSCYLSTCLLTVAKGGGTQPLSLAFVGEGNTIKGSEHASAAAALQWLWKHGLSVQSMGFEFLKQTFDYQQRMRYMPPDEPDFLFGSEVLGMAYPVGQAASAVLQLLLLNGGGAAMGTALPMPMVSQRRVGMSGSAPVSMSAQQAQQQQQQDQVGSPWQGGMSTMPAPQPPMAVPAAPTQAPTAAPPLAAQPYLAPPATAQAPGSLAPQPQPSMRQALAAWAQQALTPAPAPPAAMAQQHTAVAQARAPAPAPTVTTATTAGSAAAPACAAATEGIRQPRQQALQHQQQQQQRQHQEQELVAAYEQLMQHKAAEAEQQQQEQPQRQQQEQARTEAQQVQQRQQELEQQQAQEEAQFKAEMQLLQSQEQQRQELQQERREQQRQQRHEEEEEVAQQQQKEHGTAHGAQPHEDDWLLVSANSLPCPTQGPASDVTLLAAAGGATSPRQAPQQVQQAALPEPVQAQSSAASEAADQHAAPVAAAAQQAAPAEAEVTAAPARAAQSSPSTAPVQGSSALQAIAQVPDLAQLLQQPAPPTVPAQQGAGSRGLSPGPGGPRSNEEWRSRWFQTWGRVLGTGAVLETPLVWIDLEMTGLDPQQDKILEIAAIITDGELSTVIEGPCIAIHHEPAELSGINAWSKGMHERTGLLQRVADSSMGVSEAEAAVVAWIRSIVPARCANLAGSSVYVDSAFIMRHMPALHGHLHHRVVDVSTLLELARRWYPAEFRNQPCPNLIHGALQDITDSIEQLRYWHTALFKASPAATLPEQEQAAAAANSLAAGCASDIGCAAGAANIPTSPGSSGLGAVIAAPSGASSGSADVRALQQVAVREAPPSEHHSTVAAAAGEAVEQLPDGACSSQPLLPAAALEGLQATDTAAAAPPALAAPATAAPAAADTPAVDSAAKDLLGSDAVGDADAAAAGPPTSVPAFNELVSLAADVEAVEAAPGMCDSRAGGGVSQAPLEPAAAGHTATEPAHAAAGDPAALLVSAAAEPASAQCVLQPAAWSAWHGQAMPQEAGTPQPGATHTGSQAKAPSPPATATALATTAEDATATAAEAAGALRQVAEIIDVGKVTAVCTAAAQQMHTDQQDQLESSQTPGEAQLMSSSVGMYDVHHRQPGFLPGKEKGEETGQQNDQGLQQRQIQQDQEQQEDTALLIIAVSQGQHEQEPKQQQKLLQLDQQEQARTPVADSAEATMSPFRPAHSIDSTHSIHGNSAAVLAELNVVTAALTEEVMQHRQEERDGEGCVQEDSPPGLFSSGKLWPAGAEVEQLLQQGSAEEAAAAAIAVEAEAEQGVGGVESSDDLHGVDAREMVHPLSRLDSRADGEA